MTTVNGDNIPVTKIDLTKHPWIHVGKKMAQKPLINSWRLLQFTGNYPKNDFQLGKIKKTTVHVRETRHT